MIYYNNRPYYVPPPNFYHNPSPSPYNKTPTNHCATNKIQTANHMTKQMQSTNYISNKMQTSNHVAREMQLRGNKFSESQMPIAKEKQKTDKVEEDTAMFEIFGIKLFFDDILLICLIFFLYAEGVKDQSLFIALILLLLS